MKLYYYYDPNEYEDYDNVTDRLVPISEFNQSLIDKVKTVQGEYFTIYMNSLDDSCLANLFNYSDTLMEYIIDIDKYFDVVEKLGYKVYDEKTQTLEGQKAHQYYENTYGYDGKRDHFLSICKKLINKSKLIQVNSKKLVLPYIRINCQALPYISKHDKKIKRIISEESFSPLMTKW